eukprot:364937-Chlamydomonas_euryale.AAC.7
MQQSLWCPFLLLLPPTSEACQGKDTLLSTHAAMRRPHHPSPALKLTLHHASNGDVPQGVQTPAAESAQRFAFLKDDPDLKHVFEDVQANGPEAVQKVRTRAWRQLGRVQLLPRHHGAAGLKGWQCSIAVDGGMFQRGLALVPRCIVACSVLICVAVAAAVELVVGAEGMRTPVRMQRQSTLARLKPHNNGSGCRGGD